MNIWVFISSIFYVYMHKILLVESVMCNALILVKYKLMFILKAIYTSTAPNAHCCWQNVLREWICDGMITSKHISHDGPRLNISCIFDVYESKSYHLYLKLLYKHIRMMPQERTFTYTPHSNRFEIFSLFSFDSDELWFSEKMFTEPIHKAYI